MNISNIEIFRDGGTITFTISDDALAGDYRLQTPFLGEPRPLLQDQQQLEVGSLEEQQVLEKLKDWIDQQMDDDLVSALQEIATGDSHHPMDERLQRARPFYLLKGVIDCLERR